MSRANVCGDVINQRLDLRHYRRLQHLTQLQMMMMMMMQPLSEVSELLEHGRELVRLLPDHPRSRRSRHELHVDRVAVNRDRVRSREQMFRANVSGDVINQRLDLRHYRRAALGRLGH